ncbi:CAAD domain-containing protein [Thermoleptolyngbya sp. M55_K2018_002]|uniref:CAAD domain-containing protein n=1 Tax=Thermoleptolyngbya sp. M55_K2018_002 TaxID=2747808 RepID=UPI0019FB1078|nr:CAAD domain-containing protein [Thermoleptolyngbya sp. M55_K2018_002]HIK40205.1 CAAD domain-containing protein [Thermoleptolyngbya sp. M55_K2018_002]
MEPEVKNEINTPDFINAEDTGKLTSFGSEENTGEEWREYVDKATEFVADLPKYLSEFFGQYKSPFVTIGLLLAALIAVRLVLAILRSVNDIPLLAPTFELIGLGYTAWFVYRYLLRASNRKELVNDFNELKSQVLGHRNNPPL